MRRLVHVSDLHFGRDRPELLAPLAAAIGAARPDLVVVSGDLTQRARAGQFAAARRFLDGLGAPWLSVPGNHDVPLGNLAGRLLRPYAGYRRRIARDLEPLWSDGAVAVAGLNTTDPLAWQRGRARPAALARVCRRLTETGAALRVVVAHHPFVQLPAEPKAPMAGAAAGIEALAGCGVGLVLSGHLHTWRAAPVPRGMEGAVTLQVQAGTGLSTRQRGEPNDFNLVEAEAERVAVTRLALAAGGARFAEHKRAVFARRGGFWVAAD